ncbi:MAG: hypothetical protein NTV21_08345 [Planctomycetota bacterium]|nr:hypothetical protein [Planctomycetota bacterium]
MPDKQSTADAELELASFFAKYPAAIAKLGKALRKKLQARLPGFNEIVYVYESQGSLVISYSASENGYEAVCTLALYEAEVKLFLAHGPQLAAFDAKKLRAEIETLIAAALKLSNVQPNPKAQGSLILKADSQKKRAAAAKQPKTQAVAPDPKRIVAKKRARAPQAKR